MVVRRRSALPPVNSTGTTRPCPPPFTPLHPRGWPSWILLAYRPPRRALAPATLSPVHHKRTPLASPFPSSNGRTRRPGDIWPAVVRSSAGLIWSSRRRKKKRVKTLEGKRRTTSYRMRT